MIDAIQPNEELMIAAMAGALVYMLIGYMDNKQKNPDMPIDYGYVLQTFAVMGGAAALLADVQIIRVTFTAILMAFFSGLGVNKGFKELSEAGGKRLRKPKSDIE